jgi:hypothetical protein
MKVPKAPRYNLHGVASSTTLQVQQVPVLVLVPLLSAQELWAAQPSYRKLKS